ncbi:hypothetical protein EG328_007355 [Venturia inaequalis]|uniref:Elongation factor G, mitochondrial n=1 Tax=Venturia inaequalis TaxID=5025 RepID=A0A8H3UG43_VENIN|nr:hypothetical protein EG328_007355 [Venturia inaequalis]
MTEESKEIDPKLTAAEDAESDDEEVEEVGEPVEGQTETRKKKKRKPKKKKLKDALTSGPSLAASETDPTKAVLTDAQFQQLLAMNPSLKNEVVDMDPAKVKELMQNMDLTTALSGMSLDGTNKTDMASFKFWKTQPVTSFEDARKKNIQDGPIKQIDIERVPKEPEALDPAFEWVTMDLEDPKELEEVYKLLSKHYVEDKEAMFRFHYTASFFNWALKAPGWKKDWHVGIRGKQEPRKLVAFISGIPVDLRVRKNTFKSSEVNFLCIHKQLRAKRLTPILIKEITRRCYLAGTYQAIYTAGVMLPTPVTTCRYFHRALEWTKLYELKFSPLPAASTPARQVAKYKLPDKTATPGLREMEAKDVTAVTKLLNRYLGRFDMQQHFSEEEVKHWMLHDENICPERVVYAYVVEDPSSHKVTDFFSFYSLASTAIASTKYQFVNAAYMYYYASDAAFDSDKAKLGIRLNLLIKDALILAKKAKFDVLNALTLLDNPLFLEKQLFGAGDGSLHYYLYNYRAAPIAGGIDEKNKVSDKHMGAQATVLRSVRNNSSLQCRTPLNSARCLSTTTLRPVHNTRLSALTQWQSRRHQSGAAAAVLEKAAEDPMALAQETIIANLDPKEADRLSKVRNIGIAAHIDSGKTTATERVLFYTGRINSIHEVRGKDSVGAKMDSMDLEREKGITIQSAATFCEWIKKSEGKEESYHINLIDTPGHIDFTIEVERALRVLDGAVMILCAVSGVQSQTITVDRQMRRYNIPRLSFINKMDRMGANPFKAIDQINHKLRIPAAAIQVPIGREDGFLGVVDLVRMKAIYFEGPKGINVVETDEIPADVLPIATERRSKLIEVLADVDDEMAEMFLDEVEPTQEQIKAAIRRATISLKFTPVLMGSALADKAVQPMLDAVCDYLPNPAEVENLALDRRRAEAPVKLVSYNSLPFVGLAFKLEEGNFGQLTYIRVYQGSIKKGMNIFNARNDKKIRIPRIVRMHSNEMEEVSEIGAGEICAVFGVDCASGDTFTDGTLGYSMTSMFVPDPVISLSIKPKNSRDGNNFSKAMNRFQREDPTFRVHVDQESQQTIISGMGELHLDIYVERIRREYNVECETGQPQVAYRETITKHVAFDHLLKKQTGGSGDYARVCGWLEPTGDLSSNVYESQVTGGHISEKFLFACEKGFHASCDKGPLVGHRVLGTNMVINDGATHMTDSSEMAFKIATQQAFRKAFAMGEPQVLEPLMKTTITAPNEFQGNIVGLLNKRNAVINETDIQAEDFTLYADCSLNSMFGFSSLLRAATQGKGEFSMEFSHYNPAPPQLQRELVAKYEKYQADRNKK